MTCIEHKQKGDAAGYGRVRFEGKNVGAHRAAYFKAHNLTLEQGAGLVVMHECDNPRCINPEHLKLGTQQDNINDKMAKGRHFTVSGEATYNAKLTDAQVATIRERYTPYCPDNGGAALGREFGISQQHISNIINNHKRGNA